MSIQYASPRRCSTHTTIDLKLSAGNVRDVYKVADEPVLRLERPHQVAGLREEGATLRQEVPYRLMVSFLFASW